MDIKFYKDPRNRGFSFNKQPRGLDVIKAKEIAYKDISADDSFERNYIMLDYLVYRFRYCPLQYYTLDLEIY